MTTSAPAQEAARPERTLAPGLALDRLVGRVTMYRLVVLVLLVIAAAALVASLAGVLAFPPLGLGAALAVALVVGWGSNRLFAAIRRIRPHAESGVITGLLGFFLFLPIADPRALGALALAIAVANLSKYVLVIRGRHVANPIAIGAVVVLLTGISGATWWVATPVLLPFVLVGGALVVRRAGAWDLALPVLLIALPGTAIRLLATGSPVGTALWTAVASYPFLFLAAFMLSEPLTAPPRRWQRILVSALVGVLSLIPLRVGYVGLTPEVALVLANVVAFAFGQRRRMRLVLDRRAAHAGGVEDLRFTSERPLTFRPGQYLELSLPHARQDLRGARRAFSPASAPGSAVRIVTRQAERPSSFKRALTAVAPGEAVAVSVLAGDFLPPRDRGAPVVWLAGGVGVTPFLAMAEAESDRDAVLVWRLHEGDDPAWAAEALAHVRVLVVGPASLPLPAGWQRLGERLDAAALAAAVPDLASRAGYAAGSPTWIGAARAAARRAGLRRLRTDRFLGY
ncbi:FAD-dependent oxidoreductase [Amnibacterium setariae]|uniref:FAD-dependent oxidoreductase n=1 Tax=Amnibacterium setariae TaxID=2306585 RepID=A0A3A1U1T3_9MICO|nr:FAD-dependent oxidoreductase [Amnibacterium setariae]RIX27777.1 FAD-dependent oxidoreductase [Amnibacterium setariae]